MWRRLIGVALLAVTLAIVPATSAGGGSHPEIVAIYPDPVAHGDDGEFVVVDVPDGSNLSRYALTDGETTVALPEVPAGRVALTSDGHRPARLDGHRVVPLPARLQLANSGELVHLQRNGTSVDSIWYRDAREGEVLSVRGGEPRWRALGATNRSIVSAGSGHVRAFVLPDAGGLPTRVLRRADRRILLAGYTLTSDRVAAALRRAHRRNVTVRVLVEGGPVGGVSRRQVAILENLTRAGIEVRVVGGPRTRYRFHHAKYAVVDDRALVTTENWKPAGVGGRASRGWGVLTNQSRIVAGLSATFRADAGWVDAIPWARARTSIEAVRTNASTGRFGRRTPPTALAVDETELLVAPDNAEARVLALLRGANESIWIEQPSVGGLQQPFVEASLDAARRGVAVRVLLGSAWYNEADNRKLAERLRTIADEENLDLQVRLVTPRGRFDRLHAKGVVVDGDRVLLGSLNWNNNSARNNREVALLLRGEAVGGYYGDVIRADWRGGSWRLLVGLAAVCLLAIVGASRIARRIEFDGGPAEGELGP